MSDPLKNLLIITVVFFVLFVLWAISIGITYWDVVSRRKLPGAESAAWIALVVLIPGIGFVAYGFARLLGRVLSPGGFVVDSPRPGTVLKRPVEPEQNTGTIAAVEFMPSTSPDSLSTQKTRLVLDNGGPKYKLTLISGPHTGMEYSLDSLPVKIGRGSGVDVPLNDDQGVSRQHAEIYESAGVLRIRDLNSTHGTKVNDSIISDTSLTPGDQIRLGLSILVFAGQED